VNPIKGEVIQMSSRESKSPAFVRFLRKIRLAYPRKRIWIYTDNLLAHRSRKTREFLEKHPAIELKFLPPYSPDLNPQEQWWRHERRKLLGNRCFGTPHEPATSLSWFVHNSEPEEVRGICSLTHIESLASGK
jgi:transposase